MIVGITAGGGYLWKLALLGLLLVADMAIQATSDYGDFGTSSGAATGSFAGTLLIQFAISATMYSIMSQTFPFQVGLVGVVTSRFHKLFLVTLLYFILTIFASGLRVMNLRDADDADIDDADGNEPFFLTMSSLAKLLAPFYYSMTARAAYELCLPVYYEEEAWQKILERPLLAERVRSARMAKEATKSIHGRSRTTARKQYLHEQEGEESRSSSSSSVGSSSSVIIGGGK